MNLTSTATPVISGKKSTPERSAEEKDEAQKLIQNALSEMKKSRARRESVEDQGRISTPPGEMNPADIETMAKIRGHPMFPVLKLFTEKVESATLLKKRVNHETLIGVINESDEEASTSDGESNSRSSLRDHPANTTVAMMNTPHGTLSIPLTLPPINHHLAADSYDLGSPAGKRTRFDFNSIGSHSSSGFMERLGSSRDL
ncbi:unnamed protein product, partial [Mesorhabditis spiculigera]